MRVPHRGAGLALAVAACLAASAGLTAQAIPVSDDCVTCHLDLDEALAAPARTFQEVDVHAALGYGCLACHGSGAQADLHPEGGFLSAPQRRSIPEMCGRCHSDGAYMRQFDPQIRVDQVAEYWTSRHGELLRDRNDPDVAVCTDCHVAHQIRPPDDPMSAVFTANVPATCGRCHSDAALMEGRRIPTDQEEKYRSSVHGELLEGGDMSAPVCNDCHGNHGAAPPGMSSVRRVCGQCHAVMAEFFDASEHEEVFEDADLPGCATCHEHHDIQRVENATLNERAVDTCLMCHDPDEPGGQAFDDMAFVLDSLAGAAEHGRTLLEEAHNKGIEVSQALFELEDVTNAETQARNAIHTFRVGPVAEAAAEGMVLAETAIQRGVEANEEYRFRRVGLAAFAGIVLLLIGGLLVKIREMDARMTTVNEGTGVS